MHYKSKYQLHLIWALALLLINVFLNAANPKLTNIPIWVTKINASISDKVNEKKISDGYYYIQSSNQINTITKESYYEFSLKIINKSGVQNASEITISYNPNFQQASFHFVRIIRGSTAINKYDPKAIKVIQRETDLESKIYDGSLSAYIALSDVRVGDIIEYAYTIKGRNPVFDGKFFANLDMAYGTPISNIYYKIITNQDKKINYKTIGNGDYKPRITNSNGLTIYEWNTTCNEPIVYEDNVPISYIAYPFIDISEYANWEEVVNWALPFYNTNIPISNSLKTRIKDLVKNKKNIEDKIVELLRFVQNEIRYMGFEIGVNSHKPNSPDYVFKNRFGDCKDKAYLFCRMLKEIGVDAYPNLVNTYTLKNVIKELPSPGHFNHVTVCVELNGNSFYLDPTNSHQGGTLHHIQYTNYGYTLLIKPGIKKLTEIEIKNPLRKTTIKEIFTVKDTISPVKLGVVTEYEGIDADDARLKFEESSKTDIEKSYLDYYNSLYKQTNPIIDVRYTDNLEDNIFTTYEEYELPDVWVNEDDDLKKLQIYHSAILSYLNSPKTRKRKMPYFLAYPLHYLQNITIKFPEYWTFNKEQNVVSNDYFNYRFESYNGTEANSVVLDYELKNLASEVDTMGMERFIKDIDDARKFNMYQFYANNSVNNSDSREQEFEPNWLLILIAFIVGLLCIFLLLKLYKYDVIPLFIDRNIQIGGWLVVSLIIACLSPLVNLFNFFNNDYFNLNIWNALTISSSKTYNPYWAGFILYELIAFIGIICFQIFIIVLFLKRRSSTPYFVICNYVILLFFNTSEIVLVNFLPVEKSTIIYNITQSLIQTIVASAVWIPYYLNSKRVKKTFVTTYYIENSLLEEEQSNSE